LAELGYVQAETAEKETYEKGVAAGKEQGLEQAAGVADLADLAQLDGNSTMRLIKQGCTVEEARAAIQTMRAEKSKKQIALSTIDPLSNNGGKHGLIATCETMNKSA
jgi:hypothetical protein